MQTTWCYYAK